MGKIDTLDFMTENIQQVIPTTFKEISDKYNHVWLHPQLARTGALLPFGCKQNVNQENDGWSLEIRTKLKVIFYVLNARSEHTRYRWNPQTLGYHRSSLHG